VIVPRFENTIFANTAQVILKSGWQPEQVAKRKTSKPFVVVAIGASAGGLEAMSHFVENLPQKTGMAFVYIQHLDPTRKSHLEEILGRLTKIPVQTARENLKIKPDNIYLIPHDKNMRILDGHLRLDKRQVGLTINMPIDKFFKSLAEVHKERSIGIVLSGNANDGTTGLKEIKSAGGITFAQDSSAKFESMPRSAIQEGCVDMILSPREIALELHRLSKTPVLDKVLKESVNDEVAELKPEDLKVITEMLRKSTAVDFQHYKPNTIRRRIIRRMLLNKLSTLKEYSSYLRKNPGELHVLFQDLLINVTTFFRDADTIEYLRKTILPKIIKGKSTNDSLRVWVPACSTGEEAYSLAIILSELITEKGLPVPIQIFATDLSETAIAKARTGVYSRTEVQNVSPRRLQRYFTRVDGSYRINKSIRDLCVFAAHNLFSDPPFSRLDLISCCNLMIYLDPVLQKKILATFHYSLGPHGYLVLSKSETTGGSGSLYSQVERKYKVFTKKSDVPNKIRFEMNYRLPGPAAKATPTITQVRPPSQGANLEKKVEEILLSKYVSASVVVNSDLDILQFHGPIASFVEISPGKATLNLLKLAKPSLVFDLRNIIQKASRSHNTERKTGIESKHNGVAVRLSLEVVPLGYQNDERLFLVVFEHAPASEKPSKATFTKDQLVKKLQRELESLKDDMRTILEEQEAGNEELQSANEEITSSNEELQSINEELETSKEEIESSNEELMTINNELQVRNEQLAESYEYSEAMIETIREAVLILDKDFRVRSANKSYYRIFKTTEEETEGMLIYELGNRQWDILALRQVLEDVVAKSSTVDGFEVQHNFPAIGPKTMRLHARSITQKLLQKQLIILAIEDITEHRLIQRATQERETWFRNMANNVPVIIWMCDVDKKRIFFNQTWYRYTGLDEQDDSKPWQHAIHPGDLKTYLADFEKAFQSRAEMKMEYRLQRSDGAFRWMLDTARPYYTGNEFRGYIGTLTELHDKKIMMEELDKTVRERTQELRTMNVELQRSNDELQQFAYVASHDLQEPLRKIMAYNDLIMRGDARLSEKDGSYFAKVTESALRMRKLIDGLLEFSRISFSNQKLEQADLNTIVEEVIADLDLIVQDKKAAITFSNLPVIKGNPLQLYQLFHNLIANALKFSKDNVPPVVKITSRDLDPSDLKAHPQLDPTREYRELSVTDNGIGFNEEFSEQIFVIFQRLNEKKKYPGTGIGLALCRRIVNNHGGVISASAAADGAVFRLILPVESTVG
jgi:two-component system CheB/CheR fusion protein